MKCSPTCSNSNFLSLIKWQYWLFSWYYQSLPCSGLVWLFFTLRIYFLYSFCRYPTLWELNNHGLFLQACIVVVANTRETHHILLQIKRDPFCPLPLTHKWTKINAKKAYKKKKNILLSLLAAVRRGPEKIRHLSHGNYLTSSSLKRGADVRFVKLQKCSCVNTRLDKILIQPRVPVSSSGQ